MFSDRNMSRAEEGWDGPERFRCFVCRAKGMSPETIEHARVGHVTVRLVSAEAAQDLADELRNAGNAVTVDGDTVTGMDMACPRIARHYEENPYLNADGTEKYILSKWEQLMIAFVTYAAAAVAFNLALRYFSPDYTGTYEMGHPCTRLDDWFERVFGDDAWWGFVRQRRGGT